MGAAGRRGPGRPRGSGRNISEVTFELTVKEADPFYLGARIADMFPGKWLYEVPQMDEIIPHLSVPNRQALIEDTDDHYLAWVSIGIAWQRMETAMARVRQA